MDSPVHRVDLDAWYTADPDDVARAAEKFSTALPITVGVAIGSPPESVRPLIGALSLSLGSRGISWPGTEVVAVDDPEAAFDDVTDCIVARPQTAVALGQLLRQTPQLNTSSGLAAEAAVYSMLLGGTEFAGWLASTSRPPPGRDTKDGVLLVRDGSHLGITLDRPDRRNAMSFRMREDLYGALELADIDEEIRSVELSGAGSVFCSGGDLAEFGTAQDYLAAYLVRLDRAPWKLIDSVRERIGDNFVVRVHGAAVGAGAEIAAFGGRVTCSPDTVFRLPEVAMGLVPGAGGTVSITRRIGRWRSAWAMLTGAPIDAATALSWGLIDSIEGR